MMIPRPISYGMFEGYFYYLFKSDKEARLYSLMNSINPNNRQEFVGLYKVNYGKIKITRDRTKEV